MLPLDKSLRNKLEKAIKEAREIAETGAKAALEQLGVGDANPPSFLSEPEKALRRRLRVHGRQLGDAKYADSKQAMDILTEEIAYEHWHRMLFARFLAENNLLMDDDPNNPVSLSLDDCEALAPEKGATSAWELAARYASRMLPQIFRTDSPVFQLSLPPEHQHSMEKLVTELAAEIFTASDSLGWVYQFWQAKKKDDVNKSEVKIGARELPAVTQLFTEPYMVQFLLDNSLGAWWASKRLSEDDLKKTKTEEELREKAAIPGVPLTYLRFTHCTKSFQLLNSQAQDELGTNGSVSQCNKSFQLLNSQAQDELVTKQGQDEIIQKQGEYLPHWTTENAIYHVCFRLYDSLPVSVLRTFEEERIDIIQNAEYQNRPLSNEEEKKLKYLYSDKVAKFLDRGSGSCFLKDPKISEIVANALEFFDGDRYKLHAWCVMPNHVHVIVEPKNGNDLFKIIHSWKSFSSNKANQTLNRSGDFWHKDSYNHIIRNEKELSFQLNYVYCNPEKAGYTEWKDRYLVESMIQAQDELGTNASLTQSTKSFQLLNSQAQDELVTDASLTQSTKSFQLLNSQAQDELGTNASLMQSTKSFQLLNSQAQDELVTDASLMQSTKSFQLLNHPDQDGQVTNKGWRIAAGTYEHWAQDIKDLKILDPCCGSGHFLVATFKMLVPILTQINDLSLEEAISIALRNQIFGLELDKRCVEIAVFALALAAWTYPGAEGYRPLPQMNIACCGLSVGTAKEEWTALANGNAALRQALSWLHDFYQDAPVLGSLLNPKADKFGEYIRINFPEYAFDKLLAKVRPEEEMEAGLAAKGLLDATLILMNEYDLVITNVPYLARGKQNPALQKHCEKYFTAAKNDLATVFLDRCLQLCHQGGTASIVLPQNWLFLTSYKKFREKLLQNDTWHLVARLGAGAFETISGEVVKAILLLINKGQDESNKSFQLLKDQAQDELVTQCNTSFQLLKDQAQDELVTRCNKSFQLLKDQAQDELVTQCNTSFQLLNSQAQDELGTNALQAELLTMCDNYLAGLDVSEFRSAQDKGDKLIDAEIKVVSQARQLKNPDARIVLGQTNQVPMLHDYASGVHGLGTKDSLMFVRNFWECQFSDSEWELMQSSTSKGLHWSGLEYCVWWQKGIGELHKRAKTGMAILAGGSAHCKPGVTVTQINLGSSLYTKGLFEKNVAVVSFDEDDKLCAIWCYANSNEYLSEIRAIDQKMYVTNTTMVKVPFDLDHWQKVAEEKYPYGLPEPYSDDPTQWIFHGHPCGSVIWSEESKKLEHGKLRTDNTVLQVAIARLLGYQWPAENCNKSFQLLKRQDQDGLVTKPIPDSIVTDQGQDGLVTLSEESRHWVEKSLELLSFADDDGIVCISPVRGEESAMDRIINLLAAAYGDKWSPSILDELLSSSDHCGKSLESWLRDKFFAQHCKLFMHRPFIWQIWDGLRDGFSALVNYHKFDNRKLQSLIYSYLGDWISRQKHDLNNGIDGASEKLAAAETLQKKLILILEGDAPYDIFVRWKPLVKQAIGWNPDLNDGVRMNIRPFVIAEVLRFYKKPTLNINWDKDRGKDVPSAPWFHLDKGDRINDRHLSLIEKQEAQNAKA